jgi:hypothetical protein
MREGEQQQQQQEERKKKATNKSLPPIKTHTHTPFNAMRSPRETKEGKKREKEAQRKKKGNKRELKYEHCV